MTLRVYVVALHVRTTYVVYMYDRECNSHTHTHTHTHTGDVLKMSELAAIAAGVFQEADIAKNQHLTFAEFEHVISRAPDFVNLFHVTI